MAAPGTTQMPCPDCGGENTRSAQYCSHCGTPLDGDQAGHVPQHQYRQETDTAEVEFIGFWARVGAFLIDFTLVMVVVGLPFVVIFPDDSVGAIVFVPVLYLYFVLLTDLNQGQTLGKKALKIQ